MYSYEYILKINKYDIDFINKIVEAYEGLAIVRTLDKKEGVIKLLTNSYFIEDVNNLLEKLERYNIEIKIQKQGIWEGEL